MKCPKDNCPNSLKYLRQFFLGSIFAEILFDETFCSYCTPFGTRRETISLTYLSFYLIATVILSCMLNGGNLDYLNKGESGNKVLFLQQKADERRLRISLEMILEKKLLTKTLRTAIAQSLPFSERMLNKASNTS